MIRITGFFLTAVMLLSPSTLLAFTPDQQGTYEGKGKFTTINFTTGLVSKSKRTFRVRTGANFIEVVYSIPGGGEFTRSSNDADHLYFGGNTGTIQWDLFNTFFATQLDLKSNNKMFGRMQLTERIPTGSMSYATFKLKKIEP